MPQTPRRSPAAVAGDEVGTWVEPHEARLTARKLWIAFGLPAQGKLVVDAGAARAPRWGVAVRCWPPGSWWSQASLRRVPPSRSWDPTTSSSARAWSVCRPEDLRAALGQHSTVTGGAVVHRDDLVVLAR